MTRTLTTYRGADASRNDVIEAAEIAQMEYGDILTEIAIRESADPAFLTQDSNARNITRLDALRFELGKRL